MAYQAISLGTTADDGTGDSLRVGADKVNDNFVELYTLLGTGSALSSGISSSATVVTLASPVFTGTVTLPGVQAFSDGSASAPSITNTGDTNTGIYFSEADSVDFTTGGTRRLKIDSSGVDVTGLLTSSAGATITGTLTASDTAIVATNGIEPASSNGAALGSTSKEWSDLYLATGAVVALGNAQDVTLTHVDGTGLLLNSTNVIQFNDASQNIGAPSATVLDINATDEIELNATLVDINANLDVSGTYTGAGTMTTGGNIVIPDDGNIGSVSDTNAIAIGADGDITLTQDLELQHDGAQIYFGANSEVTVTHAHNAGLEIKHTATGDDNPVVLTLATGETDIQANDVLGSIRWQAPDEGTGTDAVLVGAAIDAISEGDFSSSNNATKLAFRTGASETATEKMSLSSAGLLTVADDIVIKSGGTIGGANDTDLLTLNSGNLIVTGTITATPTASLLVKNSGGTTLKTIHGIASV